MRVLLVVSTRSAVDQAVLDLVPSLVDRVALAIHSGESDPEVFAQILNLAARHAIPVYDESTVSLESVLRRDEWDLIETSGGADIAALQTVLDEVADRALVHNLSVINEPTAILPRLIGRADAVLCSTSEERSAIQQTLAPGRNHCFHLKSDCVDPTTDLATAKWQILAATWFTRHYLDRPFQGPRPLATPSAK